MTNPMYSRTGAPVQGSRGRSSPIRNEYDAIEDGFDLAFNYYVDSGTSANSIAITPVATLSALNSSNDGLVFRIKAAYTVTGATTINFGGSIGTKALKLQDGTALSNQIVAGQTFECVWDSTAGYMKLMSSGLSYASNGLPTTGGTMTGPINEAEGAAIATDTTIDLQSATGNTLHLTGNATVATVTLNQGARRKAILDGTPTFAHSANLICPTAANIVGAAGDVIEFFGEGGGVTRITDYMRADGSALISGITTLSAITDNTTLTSATIASHTVAMTALGKSVTLPSGLTMKVGAPKAVFRSTGGYPFGIRDNTGTLLMAVAPGGVAYVSCESIASQAGSWAITGTNLEPGLITIDSTFSSTYASTVLAPFVALDSNTSIHFAALSSGFAAFVVDNTGKVVSTPVTVDSNASATPKQVFKISATQAIVFYRTAGTSRAVVLTVSGTSPSLTLAVGTFAAASPVEAFYAEDFSSAPKIVQLSSTLYLASYTSGTNTGVIAISVSGTTVTIGSAVNIITASTVADSTTTYALTATTALVIYKTTTGPHSIDAVVISVSGTTCTVGTPATLGVYAGGTGVHSSCLLSATKALVGFTDSATNYPSVVAVTISGTTVTLGTRLTVESTSIGSGNLDYTASSATRYNPHLFPLSASTALLWYLDSSGISRAVVLSESGGTVTAGAKLYNSISIAAATAAGGGAVIPQGTSEFVAIRAQSAGGTFDLMPHKISGTTITTGSGAALREIPPTRVDQVWFARLTSGDYVHIGGTVNTSTSQMGVQELPVFRTNGDAINMRGRIKVPALMMSGAGVTWAPVAVSSNRLAILGASIANTVAVGTFQLRLLNIEVAA